MTLKNAVETSDTKTDKNKEEPKPDAKANGEKDKIVFQDLASI